MLVASTMACIQSPTPQLLLPEIVSVSGTADYHSVKLTAELDHAENVRTAGFYLWRDGGNRRRIEAGINRHTLSVEYDGLEPETDYLFAAYLDNGRDEIVSQTAHFLTQSLPMPVVDSFSVEPTYCDAIVSVWFSGTEFLSTCSVFYWTIGSGLRVQVPLEAVGEGYSCTLDGLEAEKDYGYCISYSNGKESSETDPSVFRTLKAPEPDPEPKPEPEPEPDPHPLPAEAFDPALLGYLLGHFDKDSDGVLTDLELEDIRELVLSGLVLDSHRGLEYLVNLESLSMGDNTLSQIDVSANKKLQFLSAGSDPYLEEIILDNPALFQTYFIGAENLRHLDLTHCPEMYICEWYGIPLESVDFTKCPQLYALRMTGTHLVELDLSANRKLRHLNVPDNPELRTVWLWENVKLESLEVDEGVEIKYK